MFCPCQSSDPQLKHKRGTEYGRRGKQTRKNSTSTQTRRRSCSTNEGTAECSSKSSISFLSSNDTSRATNGFSSSCEPRVTARANRKATREKHRESNALCR